MHRSDQGKADDVVPGQALAQPKTEKPEKTRSVITTRIVFSYAVE